MFLVCPMSYLKPPDWVINAYTLAHQQGAIKKNLKITFEALQHRPSLYKLKHSEQKKKPTQTVAEKRRQEVN